MTKRTILWGFLLWMLVLSSSAQTVYDVTAAGAVGNGVTDDAQAIQAVIDRCSQEGGGGCFSPVIIRFWQALLN